MWVEFIFFKSKNSKNKNSGWGMFCMFMDIFSNLNIKCHILLLSFKFIHVDLNYK
jgi:hypothetical protein